MSVIMEVDPIGAIHNGPPRVNHYHSRKSLFVSFSAPAFSGAQPHSVRL
jgi:hypothetical protein